MRTRFLPAVVLLLAAALSCSRDPEVVKRKYLESGNRYFDKGQYKEASIMYRQALRKDARYGEAYYRFGLTQLRLGRPPEAARSLRRAVETLPANSAYLTDSKTQLADIYLAGLIATDPSSKRQIEYLRGELKTLAEQLPPNSVARLRYLGYYHLSLRNLQDAIAQFRKANELSPLQPRVVLPLAQSLIAAGQDAEAEKLAKTLLDKDKTFGPVYDLLYLQYAKSNRLEEAEQILQAKVDNNPKQAIYLLQLAAHYYGMKRLPDASAVLARLTANLQDFPAAYEQVGDFYFRRGDFDGAVRHYEDGLKKDPKRKLLFQKKKAEVLIAQGKRNEAYRLLEEVLKEDSGDVQAHALRSSLLIETGTPKEVQTAISELQAMVSRMPDNVVLRFNLGRALLRKGDRDQARTQFQEAIKKQPGFLPPRIALAELHLVKAEFPLALQTAREVLELDPRNLGAKLISTNALAGMGNLPQARSNVTSTIQEHPDSREARMQMAMLDLVERRFKDAEQAFQKLHETAAPADLRGLMGLSEAYASQDQYAKAIDLLRSELGKNPEQSGIRQALANIAVRAKRYDVAISEYNNLLAKAPSDGALHLRVGEAQRRSGDIKAATASFRKSMQFLPNEPAPVVALALLLEGSGQRGEARALYEQILRLQPDHPVALNNLAYMLAETGGDLDQALTLAQRARQKMPQDVNVADTLGWIYIKKNLSDQAIEIFRDLTRQQPQISTFHYHLAVALYQKGDKIEARKALQAAQQNKPSAEESVRIKELLAKVG
ncbi:MAG: tetratricopeptide repeat protein [Acidobacteriota bacterium]